MGAIYRLVCHKCRVRMELGPSGGGGEVFESSRELYKVLEEFLNKLYSVDIGEREDRYILWGRVVELRKSLLDAMIDMNVHDPVFALKIMSFVLMHPHTHHVEIVSDYEEEKFDNTDDYEEVGVWTTED